MAFRYSQRALFLAAIATTGAMALLPAQVDDQSPLKIGLILPYKGAWAAPVENIDRGFRVAIAEFNGKVAGRQVEVIRADDELSPNFAFSVSTNLFNSKRLTFSAAA